MVLSLRIVNNVVGVGDAWEMYFHEEIHLPEEDLNDSVKEDYHSPSEVIFKHGLLKEVSEFS